MGSAEKVSSDHLHGRTKGELCHAECFFNTGGECEGTRAKAQRGGKIRGKVVELRSRGQEGSPRPGETLLLRNRQRKDVYLECRARSYFGLGA